MKAFYFRIVSIVVFGLVGLQASNGQQPQNTHFNARMSLKIEVDRTEYVRLETIGLKCSFTNETQTSLTTFIPDCLSEGVLFVESDGTTKEFHEISALRVLLARQPVDIQPMKGVETEIVMNTRLDELFPRAGNYSISLSLRGAPEIRSNPVEITICEPEGKDKEAFDFIQKNKAHQQFPVLFTWNVHKMNRAGKTLLEEFVSKYGDSVYGDYAILHLARYYRATQQIEKARTELEKLKFSTNPRIVKEARSVL